MAEVPFKPIEPKCFKEGHQEGAFSEGPKVVLPGKCENYITPLPAFSAGLLQKSARWVPAAALVSQWWASPGEAQRPSLVAEEKGRYSSTPGPRQF